MALFDIILAAKHDISSVLLNISVRIGVLAAN